MRFRDILDGLSNTIAAGEIMTDLGDRATRTQFMNNPAGGGAAVRNNPTVCRTEIDPTRPLFWGPSVVEATGNPVAGQISNPLERRGFRWADGRPVYSCVNTILPPNTELCFGTNENSGGMLAPSSQHQGGCHILMGDGAVKFVTDSIEAGDSTSGGVFLQGTGDRAPGSRSPYGLWGALGTRANREVIEEEL